MSPRLTALASRREKLIQKISAQRTDLSGLMQPWQKPLALADSGLKAVHVMRDHAALVAGSITALLAWRLHGIAGFAKSGWRLAYLYPSAIFAGYKYLSALASPRDTRRDEL